MENNIEIKVKKFRKEKGMTLVALSEKSGISVSFLSQIENGRTAMTMVTLSKIARALELPMKELFEEKAMKDDYVRPKTGYVLEGMQHNYKKISILSGRFAERRLEGFHMTMEPHFMEFEELQHPGEEFFYILRGKACFLLDGKAHEIEAGESIHFPSTIPHRVQNREGEELEMICVITPPMF